MQRALNKVGYDITEDEEQAASQYIWARLTHDQNEDSDGDERSFVDVYTVAGILLKELAAVAAQEKPKDQVSRGPHVDHLLHTNLLDAGKNSGLEVWRTLFRRFFIVDGLYSRCAAR